LTRRQTKRMSKDILNNHTYLGFPIEKVNEIEDKIYLLIRESLNNTEKDFLITEDKTNNFYYSEAVEQILFLIKTINETEIDS
jgi:hypothetical protein